MIGLKKWYSVLLLDLFRGNDNAILPLSFWYMEMLSSEIQLLSRQDAQPTKPPSGLSASLILTSVIVTDSFMLPPCTDRLVFLSA